MHYRVKREFFHHVIAREDGSEPLSVHRVANRYSIKKRGGQPLATLTRDSDTVLTLTGLRLSGDLVMTLVDPDAWERPNFAKHMELDINGEDFAMEQTPQRDFRIFQGETDFGTITHLFRTTAHLDFLQPIPPVFAAIFFAAAKIMLHEDDVDIV